MPMSRMPTDERLQQWEEKHGFAGIFCTSGRDINRKCACGKRTTSLATPFCRSCATCAHSLSEDGVQEDVPEPRAKPRRPPPTDPNRYTRCRTEGCGRIAKHRGTLCPTCWVATNPVERACPVCLKAPRCVSRRWGVCSSCTRNVKRAASRLWLVSGGNMAIACSALANEGVQANHAEEASQLLEALDAGDLASGCVDAGALNACM